MSGKHRGGFRWLAVAVPVTLALGLLNATPAIAGFPTTPTEDAVGAPVGSDPYLQPSGNGGYDVKNYDLKFVYDSKNHGIASAKVVVRSQALQNLQRYSLDARKGLKVSSVRVDGAKARFHQKNGKLHVRASSPIASSSVFRTAIKYAGKPKPLIDASGRGRFGWLRTPNGVVTYSEPNGTSTWVPSNDVFYDKATWRIDATVPSGLMAVSAGKLLKKARGPNTMRTVWKMSTPIQSYTQVVAIDKFKVSSKPIQGVRSFVAVSKDAPVSVAKMVKRTRVAMRWLTARLGPYPFKDTGAIVVFGGDSAMETAGRPTYSGDFYYAHQDTVLHEIAHQYYGNTITAAHAQDMWLHEGFATYLENVAASERKGRNLDDVVHSQYVQDGWGSGRHNQFHAVSLADPSPLFLLNSTTYFRGQGSVHALRAELGDAAFWSALRELVAIPHGRSTDTKTVVADLEHISGQDLTTWAATWLYSTGYQKLPVDPSPRAVVRQLADGLLNAAGSWSNQRKTSAHEGLSRALRGYAPMNQLVIDKTRAVGSDKNRKIFVDFHTKASPLYSKPYRSCLVFKPNSTQTSLGAWAGVSFSDDFSSNTFTTAACPTR
jgi:aminopeptidase N